MPAATVLLVIPLRHEASSEAHLVANLFDARFEKHSVVTGRKDVRIANIHLVHTGAVFAVVALHLDAMVAHHVGDTSQQVVVSACLADGITVHARVEGRQVRAKVLFAERKHILAEKTEFQFRSRHRLITHRTRTFHHLTHQVARGYRDGLAMFRPQVTNTGGNFLLPRLHHKRRKIGPHHDISKAALPVTYFEIGQHVLRDVPTEEHVALSKAVL